VGPLGNQLLMICFIGGFFFSLKDLYPSFRGQTMNIRNFAGNSIEEIVFLIGNKKNESFALVLDRIDIE
jgi:hypothetical protein